MTKHRPAHKKTHRYNRTGALLAALCLMAALGCAGCKSAVPTPTSAAAASPSPTATATTEQGDAGINLPITASLTLTVASRQIHTIPIEGDGEKKILMDAIFNHLIKSAAWPGDDPETITNRITITLQFATDEGYPTVYHVFDRDDKHCMQAGKGMYSTISDAVFWPLHDLAMGYDLPQALTIRSGKNEIKAIAIPMDPTNAQQITPQQMKDHIQTLVLDPANNRDSLSPFTPTVGGKKVYGIYKLYNEQFEELDFIHPSGLEPQTYLFSGKEPGKYIVELETNIDGKSYRYFFGVAVPAEHTK